MKLLYEINEAAFPKALGAEELRVSKIYKFEAEDGQQFRAKVTKIKPAGDRIIVHYVYVDDSYSKKGKVDKFDVHPEDKFAFKESVINEESQGTHPLSDEVAELVTDRAEEFIKGAKADGEAHFIDDIIEEQLDVFIQQVRQALTGE